MMYLQNNIPIVGSLDVNILVGVLIFFIVAVVCTIFVVSYWYEKHDKEVKSDICPACDGTGFNDPEKAVACIRCDGTGRIKKADEK